MIKVLHVEDDLVFRKMFVDTISKRFPDSFINQVDSCEDALSCIVMQPPNLIFMDIQLPDGNGLILTQKIKKFYPNILIVVLTLSDCEEYRIAAKESGADNFISKNDINKNETRKLVESLFADFHSSNSLSDRCYGYGLPA